MSEPYDSDNIPAHLWIRRERDQEIIESMGLVFDPEAWLRIVMETP